MGRTFGLEKRSDNTVLEYDVLLNDLKEVGMEPFAPPGVDGWTLEEVYSLDRLSAAHEAVLRMKPAIHAEFEKADFADKETIDAALAPYRMPNTTDLYSYSVRICGDGQFVPVVGEEGNHIFNSTYWASITTLGKQDRFNKWKETINESIENICQFFA